MNLLFIAMDIGNTAPGIVFEKLLVGMCEHNRISLVSPSVKLGKQIPSLRVLDTSKYIKIHYRLDKWLFTLLGFSIFDYIWSLLQYARLKKMDLRDNDALVLFISSGNYAPLFLGRKLRKYLGIKQIVYSVDAIPAPIGWSKNDVFYRRVKKFIKNKLKDVDALFSANSKMLKYQLSVIEGFNGSVGVVYPPSSEVRSDWLKTEAHSTVTFLYTGNIYGIRKIDTLLKAYRLFADKYSCTKLIFVGDIPLDTLCEHLDLIEDKRIEVHDFCSDLTKFYSLSDVLIDIDADMNDDVFLSSKIINYLPLNKPIVSITGANSPSRDIFKNIPSIIHCYHHTEEIFRAFEYLVDNDYLHPIDRDDMINFFSQSVIVSQFNDSIRMIVNK